MFGWRYLEHEHNRRANHIASLGFELRTFRDGSRWLDVKLGRSVWKWARYPNEKRLTGPEENRAVLGWFHRGREGRVKSPAFRDGFAQAAAKGPVKALRVRESYDYQPDA